MIYGWDYPNMHRSSTIHDCGQTSGCTGEPNRSRRMIVVGLKWCVFIAARGAAEFPGFRSKQAFDLWYMDGCRWKWGYGSGSIYKAIYFPHSPHLTELFGCEKMRFLVETQIQQSNSNISWIHWRIWIKRIKFLYMTQIARDQLLLKSCGRYSTTVIWLSSLYVVTSSLDIKDQS